MVRIRYTPFFKKQISKLKDNKNKVKLKKLILKIISNPEIGKPMKHKRKGTREVYMSSFRLAYSYDIELNKIRFLELYHKDQQ